jgi:hypothetical protein
MSKAWPLTRLSDILNPISRFEKVDSVKKVRYRKLKTSSIKSTRSNSTLTVTALFPNMLPSSSGIITGLG